MSVLLTILGIVLFVAGVLISVALHEMGHMLPAKAFGMKVTQFFVGFGRTIWSVKRGETEYGIKAIPLGGYISMAGMYPPQTGGRGERDSTTGGYLPPRENDAAGRTASTGFFQTMVQDARTASADAVPMDDENRSFYRLPVWKRIVIMLAGPFMNLVIAVVLFAVVLCGFGIQQLSTTIGSVSTCVVAATAKDQTCAASTPKAPGAVAGIKPGDTIVSIDGTPIDS